MLGYSIKDVAWLLKLHCSSRISRWEKGKALPSLKNAIKLGLLYHSLIEQMFLEYRSGLKDELLEREKQLQASKHKPEEHGQLLD